MQNNLELRPPTNWGHIDATCKYEIHSKNKKTGRSDGATLIRILWILQAGRSSGANKLHIQVQLILI